MTDLNAAEPINKILVIADDHDESRIALLFAARRAMHSNTRLSILHVIEPTAFEHWRTVEETIRAEAYEAAETFLREYADKANEETGLIPELIIREGAYADEIKAQIGDDPNIFLLVLGAAADKKKGPGPLVSQLAGRPDYLGARAIPVAVVPGQMTREEIRKLS